MTGKILMELPTLCIQYLTQLYSNPSGHTAFNSGVQHPIETLKF
jgi:hypothetical protein